MAHEAQQLEKQRAVLQKMYDELEPLEANVSAVRSRLSSLVHAERLEILDFLSEPTVDAETQAQLDAAEAGLADARRKPRASPEGTPEDTRSQSRVDDAMARHDYALSSS